MPGFRAGTAVQIVPSAAAPTKLAANGEIWIDSTASNVLKYTNPAGSTITLGAGGGSTGNWTFSGNGADLTGAATMSIASSVANALNLGNSGITVTSLGTFAFSHGASASGSTAFDLSGSTGTWKPPTGGLNANFLFGTNDTYDIGTGSVTARYVYAERFRGQDSSNLIVDIAGLGGSIYLRPLANTASGFVLTQNKLAPDTDVAETLGDSTHRFSLFYGGNDSVGTAQTAVISLSNNTAATSGAANQKWSPGIQLTGQQWNGSTSVPVDVIVQTQPVTGTTNPPNLSFYGRYNGGAWAQQMTLNMNSFAYPVWMSATSGIALFDSSTNGFGTQSGTAYVYLGASAKVQFNSSAMAPFSDLGITNGDATHRWTESWSRRYAGVEQTVAGAATLTLDPASGETIRLTLNATSINAAGISAGTGYPGEHMTLIVVQDSTLRTLTQANFSSSFSFAGGAYSVTATINKQDVLTFAWNNTTSKWQEQSRAVNQ